MLIISFFSMSYQKCNACIVLNTVSCMASSTYANLHTYTSWCLVCCLHARPSCQARQNASPCMRACAIPRSVVQLYLTDGRNNLFGCVNTTLATGPFIGCLDAGIRQASFTFEAGETVTAMNTYAGSYTGSVSETAAQRVRAGALDFTTSLVSTYMQQSCIALY